MVQQAVKDTDFVRPLSDDIASVNLEEEKLNMLSVSAGTFEQTIRLIQKL